MPGKCYWCVIPAKYYWCVIRFRSLSLYGNSRTCATCDVPLDSAVVILRYTNKAEKKCGSLPPASLQHRVGGQGGEGQPGLRTRCKLVGGDAERLDLQAERVERKVWRHHQDLLGIAHVGVAQRALQVVETGVAGQQRPCSEMRFTVNSGPLCQRQAGKKCEGGCPRTYVSCQTSWQTGILHSGGTCWS